jgi:hypothetical protein
MERPCPSLNVTAPDVMSMTRAPDFIARRHDVAIDDRQLAVGRIENPFRATRRTAAVSPAALAAQEDSGRHRDIMPPPRPSLKYSCTLLGSRRKRR